MIQPESPNVTDDALFKALVTVPVSRLHARLGVDAPFEPPAHSRHKSLADWNMQQDDAPILRYLYRALQPKRHLEFGTWMGAGTVDVLESCEATVWTINLPHGEREADGRWAYAQPMAADTSLPDDTPYFVTQRGTVVAQTDGPGFIGKQYHERGLAHRVHQILCDSRTWDTRDYPNGFFDSVLIDGGHQSDIVANDTRKALPLVRRGGLVLWHDFCPDQDVHARCPCVRGVMQGVASCWPWLQSQCRELFWINPSWLLVGVKR